MTERNSKSLKLQAT